MGEACVQGIQEKERVEKANRVWRKGEIIEEGRGWVLGGEDLKVWERREGRGGEEDLGGKLEERKLLDDRINIMIFEEVKRERVRGGRKSERRRLIKT